MTFGFPGKAFAFHKLDNATVTAENAETFAKRIEIATFVTRLYTDCASAKELTKVLSTAREELDILKEAINSRYMMGQSTQAERIGIELQYRQANNEYLSLIDQSAAACSKLEKLVSDRNLKLDVMTEMKLPSDFSPELISNLGRKSLDHIRSENEEHLSSIQAGLAFWDVAPDINVTYYRNYYNRVVASPIIPVQWTNSLVVSMKIPILFPFYERSEYLTNRASARIAAQRAYMKRLDAERAEEDAYRSYDRNKMIYQKLINHDLPMAETMVDSTFAAYRQGKLGFSELILAKRTWLDLKKEEVSLKQNLLNSRLVCLDNCERK
jgi:outer membrane protein TolC